MIIFYLHIKEALGNLLNSKLRSILAILGILVGTGSVVALITSSELAASNALSQFRNLGTNLISLNVEVPQEKGDTIQDLKPSDIPALSKASSKILLVSPFIQLFNTIYFQGENLESAVIGADESFMSMLKIKLSEGRFISFLDKNNRYCVIGHKVANAMRQRGIKNPIGQQVKLGDWYFTVIGILEPWKENMFIFVDLNNGAIIPLNKTYLLNRSSKINNILFRLTENASVADVQKKIEVTARKILSSARFSFRNPQEIIDVMAKQQATFTWLLASIGGISLVVGGIGVMNIMLVSVIERRREIGIRMAVGAKRADIRLMFLIEAIILTLLGGILGIILGIAVSYVLAVLSDWELHFYLLPPLLGFCVSVFVGIISGLYPAVRASRLDPIKTLQSE